jgi:hypothetical protein
VGLRGPGGAMQPDQSPSLYDRLVGVYNVATVVDDLIDRVMSGPRLNSNPAVDEAHHRSPRRGSITWSRIWCATRPAARSSTPDGQWVTPTDTSVSPRRSGPRSWTTCTGPCRASKCPRRSSPSWSPSWRARKRPSSSSRPCNPGHHPVAAGASAAVAPPARCHRGPLGQGSLEPARTRQPRHVGSPRRGSLGRRTQSEEG